MTQSIAIAMTNAPRGVNYVAESIASLRGAGFRQPLFVFSEPGSPELSTLPEVIQQRQAEKLGCYRNWRFALEWLVRNTPAQWLLLVQDDVIYRSDAASCLQAAVAGNNYRDVGFLSLYTSVAMCPKHPRPGWLDAAYYNNAFWGALALCLPRAGAEALLANQRFLNHNHHRKVDVLVGNCFRDMHKPRKIHVPSLADHIGQISTLGRHKIKGIQFGRRGYRFRRA